MFARSLPLALLVAAPLVAVGCADPPSATRSGPAAAASNAPCEPHGSALASWRAVLVELDAARSARMGSADDPTVTESARGRFQEAGLVVLEREARAELVAAWDASKGCQPCRQWDIARAVLREDPQILRTPVHTAFSMSRGWDHDPSIDLDPPTVRWRLREAADACWPEEN